MLQLLHEDQQTVQHFTMFVPSVVPMRVDEAARQQRKVTFFSLGKEIGTKFFKNGLCVLGSDFPNPATLMVSLEFASFSKVSAPKHGVKAFKHGQIGIDDSEFHHVSRSSTGLGTIQRNAPFTVHDARRPCQVQHSHITNSNTDGASRYG